MCERRANFFKKTVQTSHEQFTNHLKITNKSWLDNRLKRTLEQGYRGSNPCLPATLSHSRSFAWLVSTTSVTSRLAWGSPGMAANPCLPATSSQLHSFFISLCP